MHPNVKNDVFAGAFGLWLGYLLAIRAPAEFTPFFAVYILLTLVSVILVTALLRVAFTLRKRHGRRILAYVAILTSLLFIGPAISYARDREPSLAEVKDWQIFLLWGIILSWILVAELGRFIEQVMGGEQV